MGNILWLSLEVIGIWYLIYSIINRKKLTLYTRSNTMDYSIINMKAFLRAQLCVGLINGTILLLTAYINCTRSISSSHELTSLCVCILLFYLNNFLLIQYSRLRGYIKKNNLPKS